MAETRHTKWIAIGLVVAMVFALGSIGVGLYLHVHDTEETRSFAVELRDDLVRGCQHDGNPLRRAVQGILRQQIRTGSRIPHTYFPNIPTHVFKHLLTVQAHVNQRRISEITPLNCARLYPEPPGN